MKLKQLLKCVLLSLIIAVTSLLGISKYVSDRDMICNQILYIARTQIRMAQIQNRTIQVIEKQQDHLPNIIKQVVSSAVFVKSEDWSGSGVIVGPNTVLTAGHIVEDVNNLEVHTTYGVIYKVIDSKRDPNNDCGLIFTEEIFRDVAQLGDSNLVEVGDRVFIISSPFGKELFNTVAYGIVASVDRKISFFNEVNTFIIDIAGNPGGSGGPVFNMDGKVIGIEVGGYTRSDGLTAATPINICKELLYEVSICK